MSNDLKRLRGLRALLEEGVEHGSSAIERVHLATARRTFTILEAIPPIAAPVRGVHVIHDLSVASVYGSIRLVNRIVGKTLDLALVVAESAKTPYGDESG
jgi:hypothetical protein